MGSPASDHESFRTRQDDTVLEKRAIDCVAEPTNKVQTSQSDSPYMREGSHNLCLDCAQVDWLAIIKNLSKRDHADTQGLPISLPPWSSSQGLFRSASTCPMCEFFIELREGSSSQADVLGTWPWICLADRAIIHQDIKRQEKRKDGTKKAPHVPIAIISGNTRFEAATMVAVLHENSKHESFAPRTVPPLLDFSVIREWVRACSAGHACGYSESDQGSERPSGFKVLDCRTGLIVTPLKDSTYVALSYVWGDIIARPSASRHPLTVEDAMAVTLALGYEHLWVDRLCIDQDDLEQKHNQISNMDRIYCEAALVIIAAAGDDPTYGLPGVSQRPRHSQRSIETGDLKFIEIYPNIGASLNFSTWRTRAWTFQEGYLSKRRLIFTDHQVAFICKESLYSESLTSEIRHDECRVNLSASELFPSRKAPETPASFARCISEYTSRSLSYESDAFNACLGVLNSCSRKVAIGTSPKSSQNRSHIWGVTTVNNWMHLDWNHRVPVQRRPGYPSWSWLGWKERIEYEFSISHKTTNRIEVICQPNLTGSSYSTIGSDLDFEKYKTPNDYTSSLGDQHKSHEDPPRLLRITALCFHVEFGDFGSLYTPGCKSRSARIFADAKSSSGTACLDCTPVNESDLQEITALLLNKRGFDALMSGERVNFLLIKQRPRDTIYERVGMLTLHHQQSQLRETTDKEGRKEYPFRERTVVIA